ncbi:hypothetical protein L484_013948 [Morus notabilis]|uniref:Uncharacterized protein n=1 Tax=Morus notabilis TaxID=981085 RepID=W9QXM5_9ROSA|nr:hypothetical protein L484_013948 [Morus notabilis]
MGETTARKLPFRGHQVPTTIQFISQRQQEKPPFYARDWPRASTNLVHRALTFLFTSAKSASGGY